MKVNADEIKKRRAHAISKRTENKKRQRDKERTVLILMKIEYKK